MNGMILPKIAVVVPSVAGREDHLARCLAAYKRDDHQDYDLELVVEMNRPTCGWGWQKGIERIEGDDWDFLHLTCDDIAPVPGWAPPAIEALDNHVLPAPRTLNGMTGEPEYFPQWGAEHADWTPAGMSSLPFMSRDLWENVVSPMMTAHYFGDNWVSWRAACAGYAVRVRRGYCFRHYWAGYKRGAGMGYEDRLKSDQKVFMEATEMVRRGEWTEPWPKLEDS